jgi:hypothetical protein
MIVEAFSLQRAAGGVVLIVLFVIGVAMQGAVLRREKDTQRVND